MRFASVAEIKETLTKHLARAKRRNEPIVITHHGKPYALVQPVEERDLAELEWMLRTRKQHGRAWECEATALYDFP